MKMKFATIIDAWSLELQNRTFQLKLLLIPVVVYIYSAATKHMGNYIETRKGTRLEDKLLQLFPSIDFTIPVFILLYVSLFAVVLSLLAKPKMILRIIEMHLCIAVIRQVCIFIIALEPPSGIIVLHDLFLENSVYPDAPLTKDLFFSGHVASVWLYFLVAEKRYLKIGLAFATGLMSFMILCMRIHYTYDVYGALFFTSAIFYMPVLVRMFSVSKESVLPEINNDLISIPLNKN
jgi:hypothetical protein